MSSISSFTSNHLSLSSKNLWNFAGVRLSIWVGRLYSSDKLFASTFSVRFTLKYFWSLFHLP